MTESVGTNGTASESLAARMRQRLSDINPAKGGLLAFLALPGYLFESLAFLQIFMAFALLFFWVWVEPLLDALLKLFVEEDDRAEPTDWLQTGDWREWAVAYLMIPVTFLNPLVVAQDLFQSFGMANPYLRYRRNLPDDPAERQRRYRLPIEGEWTVVNGSLDEEYSHSWFPVTQRYAYDFVITDEDGRRRPEETAAAVEQYYCYDEPVVAAADGVVVDVSDTDFEPARGGGFSHPLKRDIRGNYVTIQHAPDEYSCLAHLVPGSVTVTPGDTVERGQTVGRCGHSGNSSEPHLHFQLQDSPAFETAMGLPVAFDGIDTESPWRESADESEEANDRVRTAITAGQRVSQVDDVETDQRGPATAPDRGVIGTLERASLGVAVGALFGIIAGFVLPPAAIVGGFGAGTFAGVGLWAGFRMTDRMQRPGGIGLPSGFGLVGALWWAGLPGPLSTGALLAGSIVAYFLFAAYDRWRLEQSLDGHGQSPAPDKLSG